MFEKVMNYIKDFLENTPEDIYDFSCELEGMLIMTKCIRNSQGLQEY